MPVLFPSETRHSDLAETTVVASTSYSYDAANQMTGIVDKNSGGATLVSYGYTYDAASRITQETRSWNSGSSSDTLTYGYTNNNQLTSVTHTNNSFANESFSWDANGNQTGTGYTTTTGNEQTASPGYTYTYDADGNMLTATQTSTGDVWTYTYDFRNLMTSAVEKNAQGATLAQATFTYDALGNRIGMDKNGVQTWTLYDGNTPIMDFTSTGSLATRYLNGPAGDLVDTVLARELSNGTVAWYLSDHLGTVRDVINNSGGIIDHVDYSAFGTTLDESAPSSGDRMTGFAGLERNTVTGLNLATFRVQNPGTGRWTSQDPIEYSGGDANLYRYTINSPTNAADSSGLQMGSPLIHPPTAKPPTTLPPRMLPPYMRPPGYSGPVRKPYLPGEGGTNTNRGDVARNLIGNFLFREASRQLLCKAEAEGREWGMYVYYNPKYGALWIQYTYVIANKGENGWVDVPPPHNYPGWKVIGYVHAHPFPPDGLAPPGEQDVTRGQRRKPYPWFIAAGDPRGGQPPTFYAVCDGEIMMPDFGVLHPGQYHFDPANGALIPNGPVQK